MSLSPAGMAKASTVVARRPDRGQAVLGDQISLKVLQQLDQRHYLVALAGLQRIVDSAVSLTVGSTIRTTVTALGERLELRYVDADPVATAMQDHQMLGEDVLQQLERRAAIELHASQRVEIRQLMERTEYPEAVACAGVFLGKLALPVDPDTLNALYTAQTWHPDTGADAVAMNELDLLNDSAANIAQLATTMADTLDSAAQDDDGGGERDLAQRLLNEQDEGSLAYRYGVLPVLIGDDLVELDLVCFQERMAQQQKPGGVRRLVMTFQTATLGRVEILAEAIAEHLTIGITTQSLQTSEALAAHASHVRELATRLGWSVSTVSYQLEERSHRAARHLMDHVIGADALSRLI